VIPSKNYREADWRKISLPGGGFTASSSLSWKRQRAPEIDLVPWQGLLPSTATVDLRYADASGGGKPPCQMRRSRVVAVSCPWLIAAPVERASACNAGHAHRFPHSISGIKCRTRTPPFARAPTTTPLRARQTSDCQQHGSQHHYGILELRLTADAFVI